ncbi:cytochrome P450 [Punctularia strigosozonata HHB-11173 SS5]|uniref:cytochrome P450 n=1 Tax=Punctularia strigosozonata (strain HHB-11173) TaxID=741275 RepID=UPI0004417EC5|nr:cytochrome P450 [Punctularia strigosozonata HHB-11173 SS5]EIN08093.1 cytochrome P450 [Punctularia strigosozonata HHB-11173 SS5]
MSTLLVVGLFLLLWSMWSMYRRLVTKSILRNLPRLPVAGFLQGNLADILDPIAGMEKQELCAKLGSIVQFNGFIGDEQLYVTDPRALQHILIRDEGKFEELRSVVGFTLLNFGRSLPSLEGAAHRAQRKIMLPHFSTTNIRSLSSVFLDVANELRVTILDGVDGGAIEIDMYHQLSRASLEMIGRAGIGYTFGVFDQSMEENEFSHTFVKLLQATWPFMPVLGLVAYVRSGIVSTVMRYCVDLLSVRFRSIRDYRDVVDALHKYTTDIYQKRQMMLETGQGSEDVTSDIYTKLVEANNELPENMRMPPEVLISEIGNILFAGTDTTSSALARSFEMLALHQDVQQCLRDQLIATFPEDSPIDYDALSSLPYLDAVVKEVLRLHPPIHMWHRNAREDAILPLHFPAVGTDGKEIDEVPVRKGQSVLLGIAGCNRDERIWGPDAGEFNPARWMEGLPEGVSKAQVPGIYANLMTFLSGSRGCLGFKFAEIEMKAVIALLVREFVFYPPKDRIVWKLSFVNSPCTEGKENESARMPLRVQRFNRA